MPQGWDRVFQRAAPLTQSEREPREGLSFTSAEGHHGCLSLASTVVSSHLHLIEAPRVQPGEGQAVLRGWDIPHSPAVRGVGDLLRDQCRCCRAWGRLGFLWAQSSDTLLVSCVPTTFTFSSFLAKEGDVSSVILQSNSGISRTTHPSPRVFS